MFRALCTAFPNIMGLDALEEIDVGAIIGYWGRHSRNEYLFVAVM